MRSHFGKKKYKKGKGESRWLKKKGKKGMRYNSVGSGDSGDKEVVKREGMRGGVLFCFFCFWTQKKGRNNVFTSRA